MQKQTDSSLQQEAILALRDPSLQFTWPAQQPQLAKYYAKADRWFFSARSNTCTYQETHPCNSPGLLSNLNQRNIMQQQTDGSSQQETILAPRDPPLQFTWPAQQPQLTKILCKCRQVVLLLIYAKQNLQLVCYQEKRALPAPTCQTKLHEQLQPRQDIFDKTACSAFNQWHC